LIEAMAAVAAESGEKEEGADLARDGSFFVVASLVYGQEGDLK